MIISAVSPALPSIFNVDAHHDAPLHAWQWLGHTCQLQVIIMAVSRLVFKTYADDE